MRTLESLGLKSCSRVAAISLTGILALACGTFSNNINESAVAKSSSQNTEGKTLKYDEAGVQFTLPLNWKGNKEGDKYILVTPDNSVTMIIYKPADRSLEAAMIEVDKTLKNKKNTGADVRSTLIADDMRAGNYYGVGDVNGSNVKWMLTMVSTNDKPLALLSFGELKGYGKGKDIGRIISSIRKIR